MLFRMYIISIKEKNIQPCQQTKSSSMKGAITIRDMMTLQGNKIAWG